MTAITVYAVVDYTIKRKEDVLNALQNTSHRGEGLTFCSQYEEAQTIAEQWLETDICEAVIIPMELDISDMTCMFTQTQSETIYLED